MPKFELMAQQLEKLPGEPGVGRVSYYDTRATGLLLRVSGPRPKDKVWFFEYSLLGKCRRMRLGDLSDDVNLTARRQEAARLRGIVSSGVDPLDARQRERAEQDGHESFGDLGDRALAALKGQLRATTTDEWERLWKKHVVPAMGRVDAQDPVAVRRAALKMGDALVASGRGYAANRCLELSRRIMSWAIASDRDGRYAANPLLRLKKLHPENVRTRVYSPDEVRVIVACAVGTLYEDVVPLLLATGTRATECMAAEWSEISGNTWTIPAAHAKIKHERPVHLCKFALSVLERIREKSTGNYLFPGSAASGHRERAQKEVYRVRRMEPRDGRPWVHGVLDFELHDLRRVVRSGLSDLGVSSDVAELCLGHLPSKLVRTYSPHPTFWRLREQRGAMEAWGSRLERVLSGEEVRTADVLPMVARA